MEPNNKLYKCYKPGCNKADDSINPYLTQSEYDELLLEGKLICPESHEVCGIQELKPEDYPQKPKNNKKPLIIGAGVLVIILIVGAVFTIIGKTKSKIATGKKIIEIGKTLIDSSKTETIENAKLETLNQLFKDADLIISNKDYEKAKLIYQKILDLDPDNVQAKNQLLLIVKLITPELPKTSEGKTEGSDKINKTLNLSFGYYEGETANGLANGQGIMHFNRRQIINPRDPNERYAEAGEYVSGVFHEGYLVNGKLYGKDKQQKAALIIGQ